jgi:hypothetical protein
MDDYATGAVSRAWCKDRPYGNTHYPSELREWRLFKGGLEIPPVIVVVDGSGEMCETYGCRRTRNGKTIAGNG